MRYGDEHRLKLMRRAERRGYVKSHPLGRFVLFDSNYYHCTGCDTTFGYPEEVGMPQVPQSCWVCEKILARAEMAR